MGLHLRYGGMRQARGRRTAVSLLTFPNLEDFFRMRMTALSGALKYACYLLILAILFIAGSSPLLAQEGEASLKLPDLHQAVFMGGIEGPTLLMVGLGVSALGFLFGLMMYQHLRKLPVHRSMLEI